LESAKDLTNSFALDDIWSLIGSRFSHVKKSYVILHGGLGNQLFQWAYGHQLALLGYEINFLFLDKDYLIPHTRKSLGDFLPDCQHAKFVKKKLPESKLAKLVYDPTSRLRLNLSSLSRVSNSTKMPFVSPSYDQSKKYHLGYYQNHAIVEEVAEVVYGELISRINRDKPSDLEASLFGSEIWHLRQGDTKTPSNLRSIGVLDSKFYERLPSRGSEKRYVLTDDQKGAEETLVNSDIDGIFGPQAVNVESALRIMANSSRLFTANSTLSWWGGFLASEKGAQVSIPNPFFRSVTPDPKSAFMYKKFQSIPSSFLAV
jgi:hypothetical protein